jgi:energy-coupling factor transporter ATP-binding protein EcfA2
MHAECMYLSNENAKHMTEVHKDLSQNIKQLRDMTNRSGESEQRAGIEDKQILTEIRASLSKLVLLAKNITRENSVLKKLYFKSMYQREDSVEDPDGGSFGWILGSQVEEDCNEEDSQAFDPANSFRSVSTRSSSNLIEAEGKTISTVQSTGIADESRGIHIQGTIVRRNNPLPVSQSAEGDRLINGFEAPNNENFETGSEELSLDGISVASDASDVEASDLDAGSASNPHHAGFSHFDAEEVERRRETSDLFLSFLRNDHGVFFITGKAGSGKSTLLKYLAKHQRVKMELESWSVPKKLVFISTFFWNSGDGLQMSLEGFYRVILFETVKQCPELLQVLFPAVDDCSRKGNSPFGSLDENTLFRISDLKVAFQNLTKTECFQNYRFCFFIDGLDEYKGDSVDYFAFAKSLKEIAECKDIKMVCTGRPYTEFLDTFNRRRGTIYLHELTRDDIRRFARANLMPVLQDSGFDENREEYLFLLNNIVDMSDGVFLWARLVVRSLVSGITHSDSPRDLHERLENTPKDLNGLFRKMLDGVDHAVRKRSDKMLLVAIHNPFEEPLNALAYSWLSDLDDPDFPFNQPFEGYSDEEIAKRIQIVRRQVDALTKGLLELRTRQYWPHHYLDKPYFRDCVEFFHRSVRDYLKDNWGGDEVKVRHTEIDKLDTFCRLKLAEARFARNWAYYNQNSGFRFVLRDPFFSTFRWLGKSKYALPPKYFEEWRNVMEGYQQLISSHVPCNEMASCVKLWKADEHITSVLTWPTLQSTKKATSYFHWILAWDIANINGLLKQQTDLRNADTDELSVLLAAARSPHPELVEFLLSTGSSPHQLVSVEYRLNSDLDGEKVMESRKVPVWMVFLRKMAGEYLDLDESVADLDLETRMRRSRAFSLTLEQYLKFGADRNIYFLGYLGPAKGERRANYQPPAEELFSVELLQFVQLYQPENLDSIQKLLIGSVAHQAWNQTTHLLGRFTPLLSSSRPMKTTKYRPEKLDELREKTWRVYGVISETCELLGAFSYRIY